MSEQGSKSMAAIPRRGEMTAAVHKRRTFGLEHFGLTMRLEGPAAQILASARAGQFVQLACRELVDDRSCMPLLRRPFSIAHVYQQDEQTYFEIIFRVLGPGTQWLARSRPGDRLNLLGPLGNGFTLPQSADHRCILIGGGIGLPPMFLLARQLARREQRDVSTSSEDVYDPIRLSRLGFVGVRTCRFIEQVIHTEKLPEPSSLKPALVLDDFNISRTPCIIASDDGSCGYHASVVAAVEQFLEKYPDWRQAQLYACGPDGMLKAVAVLAGRFEMACQVCMEAYMTCGIGVCQSCVVPVQSAAAAPARPDQGYQLVCSHGPVFDYRTIDWQRLSHHG